MKKGQKEILWIKQNLHAYQEELEKTDAKEAYSCGYNLIQKIKIQVLHLIEANIRNKEVIEICENLIEFLVKCGTLTFKENPAETVQLSVILNYCCYLLEEFNLRKEVADYLFGTYNEWYSIE
ncbi:MAG: hypothetical protein ACKOW2_00135 [Sphingobacteriaceae bacterium]